MSNGRLPAIHTGGNLQRSKGSSIHDVHTEGRQAQVDACGRGRESAPCGRRHRKFIAQWRHPVFFSCKKLAFFGSKFRLWN